MISVNSVLTVGTEKKGRSMVNEKKVRIMTQIALDEMKYHKKEISEGGYYKSDYVRSHIISSICNVTFSYLLVLFLFALYYADYIFVNIARLEFEKLGFLVFGIYIVIAVLTFFLSHRYFTEQYVKNQAVLGAYCEKLEQLETFYQESKEETEHDTATGV